MPKAGDVLELGPIGATFHVRKTAEDTRGRALEWSGCFRLAQVAYLSMLMISFDNEIRSVRPPQQVMKVLASVARLLGYRIPGERFQ